MRLRCLLALSLSVAAVPALAHDPLPALDWCREGRSVPIGEFSFDAATLRDYRQCAVNRRNGSGLKTICAVLPMPPDDTLCPPNQCGEFDDDYHVAKMAAFNYCNALNAYTPDPASPAGGPGSYDHLVVPLFDLDPKSFHIEQHHSTYHLGQGIKGVCMRCLRQDRSSSPE